MEPEPGIGEALRSVRGEQGAQARSLPESRYNKKLPSGRECHQIILMSGVFFFKGGFNKRECEVVATGYSSVAEMINICAPQ